MFVIHLDAFRVDKVEKSADMTIFTGRTELGKLGSETFREHFEASNNILGGKTLLL